MENAELGIPYGTLVSPSRDSFSIFHSPFSIFHLLLCIVMACCVTGVSWAEDVAPPAQLTIDQAVQMALAGNATVRAAREEVAAARARIGAARADLYPRITGNAEYRHLTNVPTVTIPSTPPTPPRTLSIGAEDNTILSVSAQQNIFSGGRVPANISRAESLYGVALGGLGTTEDQVVLQTRQAYYSVLLNQGLVRSAEQSLAAAQRQLTDATARYETGTAARFDVLRAQTQVSEAQQTLVQTRNQVEISRVALNRIIGAKLDSNYTLSEPALAPTPSEDLPTLINTAERERPELISARAQLSAAEAGIRVARSTWYPQLGLSANYQNVGTQTAGQVTGWTFIANATIGIFDGGRTRSNVVEAQALRREAQTNLEDAVQAVEQDVRQAYLNLQTARETLGTAQARLAQATEAYDVAVVRYEAGVGTATELADALAQLTAARVNAETSIYNYNIAFAALQRALGRI